MIRQDPDRIQQLATLLSKTSLDFFKEIDRREPEYQAFLRLSKDYSKHHPLKFDSSLALLGIGTGLIDFQQKDPGRTLWQPMERLAKEKKFPIKVEGIKDVVIQLAKSSRFGSTKVRRAENFFASRFPSWFLDNDLRTLRGDPYNVWIRLSRNMDDPMSKKTIVMAMKAFDMETLAVTEEYLPFPSHIPMMIDSRVTYVSLSSGIVIADPRLSIHEIASRYRTELVEAWSEVVKRVEKTLGTEFNALRLDSLLWQAGEYKTQLRITNFLPSFGLPEQLSSKISSNLLFKEIHSTPISQTHPPSENRSETEKMKAFADFVSELKEKGIRGKEYRDSIKKWQEEWKRNHMGENQRSIIADALATGTDTEFNSEMN